MIAFLESYEESESDFESDKSVESDDYYTNTYKKNNHLKME
jgi:hypothetical protein